MIRVKISKLSISFYLILVLVIAGCGGSGSSSPPGKTLDHITVTAVNNGASSDPTALISTTSGSKIAYYAPAAGAGPTQAQITTPAGVSQTVFYDTDGTPSKVVDNKTGNYLLFHPRSDGLGMEYVLFDATGNFLNGYALFISNGAWYSAQILGLPAGASTTNYGAAVYGPMTPVNSSLTGIFSAAGQGKALSKKEMLIVTTADVANLKSAMCLMGFGVLIGGPANPVGILSMGAGAAKLAEALTDIQQNNLGILAGVTRAFTNELNSDQDVFAAGTTVFNNYQQKGSSSLPADTGAAPIHNTKSIGELPSPPPVQNDSTPTQQKFPATSTASSMPTPTVPGQIVTSVEPLTATVGQPVNIIIHGSSLGGWDGIIVHLTGWPDVITRGGTDTAKTFTFTPTSVGILTGTVFEGKSLAPLHQFSINVTAVAPKVSSVTPLSAQLNQLATFAVTGTNLVGGMDFSLDGSGVITELSGGTSTVRRFSCTPAASGIKTGVIKDKPGGASLFSFQVTVGSNQMTVTDVAPSLVTQNQYTTFTVTGTNMVSGMELTFDGGSDVTELSGGTGTVRRFTCIPTLAGSKTVTVKDKPGGTTLFSRPLSVTSTDITITSVSPNVATLNQLTTFTVIGTNLVNGMSFSLDNFSGISELSGGTATIRRFSGTPVASGPKTGVIKNAVGGIGLYTFHVTVGGGAATTPGVMSLSTPWHGLTSFAFPSTPYYFYKNATFAMLGIVQSKLVFQSTTAITGTNTYYNGPVYITAEEIASTSDEQTVLIRMSSTGPYNYYISVLQGELMPILSGGGLCHVTGPTNPQSLSSCASAGIKFDRAVGKLTFTNTPLFAVGGSSALTTITSLTLSFTPY